MEAYSEIIHPMPDIDVDNIDEYPLIDLSNLKRLLGRPRKA